MSDLLGLLELWWRLTKGLPGLQCLRSYYLAVYVDIIHLVQQVYLFAFAANVYLVY